MSARAASEARAALREALDLVNRRKKCGPRTMDQLRAILKTPLQAPSVVTASGLSEEEVRYALDRLMDAHPGVVFTIDHKAGTLSAPGCVPETELREAVYRAPIFKRRGPGESGR